jgi:putative addiction module component (TIGR02574 family)
MKKKMREELFGLPAEERLKLAEELYLSVDVADALTPEQKAELERELADYDKDPQNVIPFEVALKEMRARVVARK